MRAWQSRLQWLGRIQHPRQEVVDVLQRLKEQRWLPQTIGVDNGPEFTSKWLDQWACLNGVALDFSRPGKPTDNAFIEAFISSRRSMEDSGRSA